MTESLLNSSSRVALAAILHDLGKFAERAGVFANHPELDAHRTLYCPHRKEFTDAIGHFSHHHAAHSALAIDLIEERLPDLIRGDMSPFASRREGKEITDSLINAAASHHRPATFLQWIIATADRVASGFERADFDRYNEGEEKTATGRNHYQARQLTLFEQIRFDAKARDAITPESMKFRYPLKPLSPTSIFPVQRDGYEPNLNDPAKKEYADLWEQFIHGLEGIPKSHRGNWSLWLDHFDSLWLTFTQAIPSATAFGAKPDVSLYDHSKTTAALATALWRWHHDKGRTDSEAAEALKERADWDESKFLLVQGDFFGIQDFIFAGGNQTNKQAAKLMRGRSFYVSLLTELAALKILDALELPSTSQIINAAGKFLIVAPATADARVKLEQVEREINDWFLQYSFGEAGIGLALLPACCNDFLKRHKEQGKRNFTGLMKALFEQLEQAKLQRMNLCSANAPDAIFRGALDRYKNGVCELNSKLPADDAEAKRSQLSADQVEIGEKLTKQARLLITRNSLNHNTLKLDIFGYRVQFTDDELESGKFGKEADTGNLLRAWDFSTAEKGQENQALWNGYARRTINGYVPRFTDQDLMSARFGKYDKIDEDDRKQEEAGKLKTLNHIACDDRQPRDGELTKWQGQAALMTLKGDIDNLGTLFQQGYADPTFAKMAALSRQVNAFFTVWLPWYCAEKYPDTYTVFAGGDDFFLIGPWHSTLKLARDMRQSFTRYVAENAEITFSAGMVMTKPGKPIHHLVDSAESALEDAKAYRPSTAIWQGASGKGKAPTKNAVCVYGYTVSWVDFGNLLAASEKLDALLDDHRLTMGYRYGLLHLTDRAASGKPEDTIWRSQLAYRTRRFVVDKLKKDQAESQRVQTELMKEIGEKGIREYKGAYKIALFTHLYKFRD